MTKDEQQTTTQQQHPLPFLVMLGAGFMDFKTLARVVSCSKEAHGTIHPLLQNASTEDLRLLLHRRFPASCSKIPDNGKPEHYRRLLDLYMSTANPVERVIPLQDDIGRWVGIGVRRNTSRYRSWIVMF